MTREVLTHCVSNFVRGTSPDFDEFLTALGVSDQAAFELDLHLFCPAFSLKQDAGLLRRCNNILDGNRYARASRPVEAGVFQRVKRCSNLNLGVALGQVVDNRSENLLVDLNIDKGVINWKCLVEKCPPKSGFKDERVTKLPTLRRLPIQWRDNTGEAELDMA